MSYGFTVTAAGLNYLMNLQVDEAMTIDSIMVGDGVLAEGIPRQSLTDLVHPLYYATSTVPIVTDNILRMTIEFRNRMENLRPDLPLQEVTENFWLSEYGVFVRNSAGERILLYYGNLSAFPEPVIAFNPNRPLVLVKRYPVEIVLLQGEVVINLDYASVVFVTHSELATAIEPFHSHISDYNNPHRTTAEQIGAEPLGSTTEVKERVDNHIGHGGTEQHPLADKGVPGFTQANFTESHNQTLDTGFIMATLAGISENEDVVVRAGAIPTASGTVVFRKPFDTVPYVFIPLGGTTTNVTVTGFTYSGSAANRFWVAVTDNS